MLEHLILSPKSGLCNRMRAIAAARRLCRRLQARCSIVWDWGRFTQFFAPLADADVVRFGSLCGGAPLEFENGDAIVRQIDVRPKTVKVRSCHLFGGEDEPMVRLRDVRDYLPSLADHLRERVDRFVAAHFPAVGFHIRRTDNRRSIAQSPDALFLTRAREIVASGARVFLATDNCATEELMRRAVGDALLTYPKRDARPIRWPRKFDPIALEDDLVDLFVLARTEYILGSSGSSFSEVAILLNGSPRSQELRTPAGDQPYAHDEHPIPTQTRAA